jgi:leucyl-tRNA synthetase
MNGHSVLHPMGFDAFGLPAENYALKTKTNPADSVKKNVARYKKQLEILGFDYDWSREVNTTDPKYYKWTQWIFLKLLEKGLAYESFEPINWCPSCKTGLANEDVEDGRCERCGTVVEKKHMRQWVLKITDYAERLLSDLDLKNEKGNNLLDWPEAIKTSQKNWIGKSEGALLKFKVKNEKCKIKDDIEVFTTRPDTLFGVTYVVLAPEHKLVSDFLEIVENKSEVEEYIKNVKKISEIDRTDAKKEKTGVELKGIKVINPANNEEVPLWIADYVLPDYGTGAVMAVPAHDDRDWEFATKYNLPIKQVVAPHIVDKRNPPVAYTGDGIVMDSAQFNGRNSEEVKKEITEFVGGQWVTKYKLRDWVFSRQRYWGEPIPVIHCENCKLIRPESNGIVPVPVKDLPVELPRVKSYEPTGTGESPLASIDKWVNVKCPVCKGKAKRETNTMPQWAGSSWYYLRYMDPKNSKALVDGKKEKYWSPVDVYVGGAEHATRHLIYARFWHKFLYDIGIVSSTEPFIKLQHVGLIMGEDGRKMSKRFGNVVNPDDIVKNYGADSLRLYEMFMGPFDQEIAWSTASISGVRRFIEKVWKLRDKFKVQSSKFKVNIDEDQKEANKIEKVIHKTIKKVTEDIQTMRFNTAISGLMIAVNEIEKFEFISKVQYQTLLQLVAPFAPHFTEEIWTSLGNKKSIHISVWPKYEPSLIVDDEVTIMIQVNGKVRGSFVAPANIDQQSLEKMAKENEDVKKWLEGKSVVKVIVVPKRLVNFVVS